MEKGDGDSLTNLCEQKIQEITAMKKQVDGLSEQIGACERKTSEISAMKERINQMSRQIKHTDEKFKTLDALMQAYTGEKRADRHEHFIERGLQNTRLQQFEEKLPEIETKIYWCEGFY